MENASQKIGTVRIRCPYCQKVFLCRKKKDLEGKNAVSLICPHCGSSTLIPAEKLKE